MALRKPLVIVDGQIEQLQSGDTLDAATTGKDIVVMTNNNANSITLGQLVYVAGDDACDLAIANAAATAKPIGMVANASIATATAGNIQLEGVISSTDWTAVTGATTLTAGATYYLSPDTAGRMTSTPPSTAGQYVVEIGVALSSTDFAIDIKSPILL